MSFLFGGAPQAKKDPVRDYQRELRHSTRSMDREDLKASAQEKALLSSITKLAREQRIDLCKAKAKELVRLRAHRGRLATMKGHMTTLQQQLATVQGAKVMQETVAKTSQLLRQLNARLDAKAVHRMLMDFERNSVAFADGQEVLEETLDGIFEAENEQASTDQAVAGVFQELGLETEFGLARPRHDPLTAPASTEELEARLDKLRTSGL